MRRDTTPSRSGCDRRLQTRRRTAGRRTAGCRAPTRPAAPRNEKTIVLSGDRLIGLANRAPRSERDEDVESEHRRRQHERQRHERVNRPSAATLRERQPAGQRQADDKKNQRRRGREAEAEGDGRPVHCPMLLRLEQELEAELHDARIERGGDRAEVRGARTAFGAPRFTRVEQVEDLGPDLDRRCRDSWAPAASARGRRRDTTGRAPDCATPCRS